MNPVEVVAVSLGVETTLRTLKVIEIHVVGTGRHTVNPYVEQFALFCTAHGCGAAVLFQTESVVNAGRECGNFRNPVPGEPLHNGTYTVSGIEIASYAALPVGTP